MNDNRPDTKVTLEDLLRFKRGEKPDAAFWTRFEQEFRAKQLAAAVERKRWWHGLPRFMPVLVRLSLPVGATAVLALTFVSVRQSNSPSVQPVVDLDPAPAVPVLNQIAEAAPATPSETLAETVAESATVMVASNQVVSSETVTGLTDLPEASLSPVAQVQGREDSLTLSPSARLIAANMAESGMEFSNLLHRRGEEVRVVEEPLAQIPVPSVGRTSRVMPPPMAQLASYSLENERSSQVTERQARRLSEDQFYDAARRLSAQADRLMLKL